MASQTGLKVNEVAGSGPGLAFIVYPLALAKLPGAPVWSVVFFLTLLTLGVDSMFGTFETVISGILDAWPRLRKYNVLVVACCCCVLFVFGLVFCTNGGMYYYQLIDWYAAVFTAPIIALSEIIAVFYIYGLSRFSEDVRLMLGNTPPYVLKVLWVVATPLVLALVLIIAIVGMSPPTYGEYKYPSYVHPWGLLLGISTALPIPVTALWVVFSTPPEPYPAGAPKGKLHELWFNLKSRLLRASLPSDAWLPQDAAARRQYKVMRLRWKQKVKPDEQPLNTVPNFAANNSLPETLGTNSDGSVNRFHKS